MSTIRTFVSIHLENTPEMDGLRSELGGIQGIRVSPPEQTHITLRFLGDVDESRIPKVIKAAEDATAGVQQFEMTVSGVGAFPNPKRPNVIWMGVGPKEQLTELSDRLSRNLKKERISFDDKPFSPHVTVARCRDAKVPAEVFTRYENVEFARYVCRDVRVMSSVLGPKGARHSVVAKIPLE